jgi:hypothetical protein
MKPSIGRIVHYQGDERGGLRYKLPAIINCTRSTHPSVTGEPTWQGVESGEPDGTNPVPVPLDDTTVHLTVFTPGAKEIYVEHNVPFDDSDKPAPRTWHWPEQV